MAPVSHIPAAMQMLVLLATLLIPAASHAASPEESYIATRDAHIKALQAANARGVPQQEQTARHDSALADLERLVRRLVGPTALKDVAGQGRINLENLLGGDQDFGMLDGLVYASKDGKTRTIVTTQNLLRMWIKENKDYRNGYEFMPQGMAPALRWAPLYTQALGGGAAFGGFAEIPVGVDKGFATAQLVARSQIFGPREPRELVVAVIRGQRVFIVSTPAAATLAAQPECDAIWEAFEKKSDAAYQAYRDSDAKDQTILDKNRRIEDETDAAYRGCFAERAPRDPNYKAIVAQAQAIVDALPVK